MSNSFRASMPSEAGFGSIGSTISNQIPFSPVPVIRSWAARFFTCEDMQRITTITRRSGSATLKNIVVARGFAGRGFAGRGFAGRGIESKSGIALACLAFVCSTGIAQSSDVIAQAAVDQTPQVEMVTSEGSIVLALDRQRAPSSVANFLEYVNSGFYDGTIFHRVIESFMIQGGGFTANYTKKVTNSPIKNEANNGLKNLHYTIAMARTNAPHSATAQFFINSTDQNNFLDYTAATQRGWGYAVFGRVIKGKDVVDRISRTATGAGGPFSRDVPLTTVTLQIARQLHPEAQDDGAQSEGAQGEGAQGEGLQSDGANTSAAVDTAVAIDTNTTSEAAPVKTE